MKNGIRPLAVLFILASLGLLCVRRADKSEAGYYDLNDTLTNCSCWDHLPR